MYAQSIYSDGSTGSMIASAIRGVRPAMEIVNCQAMYKYEQPNLSLDGNNLTISVSGQVAYGSEYKIYAKATSDTGAGLGTLITTIAYANISSPVELKQYMTSASLADGDYVLSVIQHRAGNYIDSDPETVNYSLVSVAPEFVSLSQEGISIDPLTGVTSYTVYAKLQEDSTSGLGTQIAVIQDGDVALDTLESVYVDLPIHFKEAGLADGAYNISVVSQTLDVNTEEFTYAESNYFLSGTPRINYKLWYGEYVEMGWYPQSCAPEGCEIAGEEYDGNGNPKSYLVYSIYSSSYVQCQSYLGNDGESYVLFNDVYYLVEPIKWKIIGDNGSGSYYVLSDMVLGTAPYSTYSDTNDWSGSSLYEWLMGSFYQNSGIYGEYVESYGGPEYSPVQSGITLLSADEYNLYVVANHSEIVQSYASDFAQACGCSVISQETPVAQQWWLRDMSVYGPQSSSHYYGSTVYADGSITEYNQISTPGVGIRPAMWITF